jgi:integrase
MRVSLFRRGKTYHYDFGINGRRYRGTTKATTETKAEQVLKRLIAAAQQGQLQESRRVLRMCELEPRFTKFVGGSSLDPDTKRYYKQGWALLEKTPLSKMRIDRITRDQVDAVGFGDVSNAYANQARRTLRRMLSKAVDWNLLGKVPKIKLAQDNERHLTIGPEDEAALLSRMGPVVKDAFLIMQDGGLRPEEVARMRIEHINWQTRTYYNASGKTTKARRFVPLSDRVFEVLFVRAGDRKEGWLFPAKKAKSGHVHPNTLSHRFTAARRDAGLSDDVVLYSARHTFATDALAGTGNVAAVMNAMGHTKAQTLMRYQHPEMDQVREAINARNVTIASQAKKRAGKNPG